MLFRSQRAVKVLEASLGADNDYTAMAFNNLAKLYIHQGKYREAQKAAEKYSETIRSGASLGVPTFNTSRFLRFIGYHQAK